MPFHLRNLYRSLSVTTADLDLDRRAVEPELRAFLADDPIGALCVLDQVLEEWDTMSGEKAFWAVVSVLRVPELMGPDADTRYPNLAMFFEHYVARALTVVSLRAPEGSSILSSLLHHVPLTPTEVASLSAGYQAYFERRRALLRGMTGANQ